MLLLEAGGPAWSPMLHLPLGAGRLIGKGLHGWRYWTEPQAELGGRRLFWPRGKVMGGSSAINGCVYIRGHARDFDQWAQLGNRGWSYAEVLPYFKRAEGHVDRRDPLHGNDGPLGVAKASYRHELFDAFLAAAQQAGHGLTEDFNGPSQEGFGRYDFNILRGRRRSAATSYLSPIRGRPNLTIVKRAHVRRVILEKGRAFGVEYERRGGLVQVRANREVVLSAGAIGSPHLLMLSGIGDPAMLQRHGIPVMADLRGVGQNLQDHQTVYLRLTCREPITLHSMLRIDRAAWMMLQGMVFRRGLATTFPTQGGSFVKSRPGLAAPDLQISFTIAFGGSRIVLPFQRHWRKDPREQDGFMIMAWLLRPESHGSITLRSADPHDNPVIDPRYLSAPADRAVLRESVTIMRRLAAQPALARYVKAEQAPGSAVQSEAALDEWIGRDMNTSHHQVGTCKMGSDAMAVVDDQLRVRGIAGLRVADAAIMPTLIGGNTHATAVMIGEKAADMVLGRPPLATI